MIKAWEVSMTVRPENAVRSFVVRAMVNRVIDCARQARRVTPFDDETVEMLVESGRSCRDYRLRSDVWHDALSCGETLSSLDEQSRRAIMAHAAGFTADEAARYMGVTKGAYKSRLYRAMKKLKDKRGDGALR